jgi:hypothetical protein
MRKTIETDFLVWIGSEKQEKRKRLNQQKQDQEMMLN